jgi:crotonobetainyl-CoA:carnitine CoA-transferase CaiB-like acyl-CoA transferase
MLSNTKVLDLSRVLAGPLCTMTLGDLGADVIKVERPNVGDDTRGWGPPFDDRGESAYYLSVNRNKKSIAVDLADEGGRETIRQLARQADVVVDNFKSGTLERWGLNPQELLRANPRLIWCTISGFGPSSSRVGYDLVVQAESGWMSITGERDGDPMRVGVALADIIAGKDATIAILAALSSRNSLTYAERYIHISLSASATAALINVAQNSLVTGRDARRWGNQHPNLVPYQLFHAADRPMIVAVGSDSQWTSCARALDLIDLMHDESLATNAGRLAQRDRVVSAVGEKLRTSNASEWIRALDNAGVPCGVVKTVLEALSEIDSSPLTGIAPSLPGSIRFPPPRLDEHGEEIRSLGWASFQNE